MGPSAKFRWMLVVYLRCCYFINILVDSLTPTVHPSKPSLVSASRLFEVHPRNNILHISEFLFDMILIYYQRSKAAKGKGWSPLSTRHHRHVEPFLTLEVVNLAQREQRSGNPNLRSSGDGSSIHKHTNLFPEG